MVNLKRILQVTACLALILFLTVAIQADPKSKGHKTAALVNGDPIMVEDVDAILKARPIETLQISKEDREAMRKEALNMLIDELIMHQYLVKNAPQVPTAEVNKRFREFQDALKAQGQSLSEFYQTSGQTEAQVRNSIVSSLQWKAYLDTKMDEATLQKYYQDNKDYFDEIKVRVSHIMLRMGPRVLPKDQQMMKDWLQGVRQQIVMGKMDFADAARQFSQDLTANKGGDLGFIGRKGDVEESFARTAFALKPNEVSDVIQTESGIHLIKLVERKPGIQSDFKKLDEKVRAMASEEHMNSLLLQQRKLANITVYPDESPAPTKTGSTRTETGSKSK